MDHQVKLNQTPPVAPQYSMVFDFEQSFVHQEKRKWMTDHWHQSIYWSLLYVLLVFGGQAFMANRPAYKLRPLLTVWNLGLATFSIIGSIRFWPEVVHVLHNFGFHHSVCSPSYVEQSVVAGFWTWMFTLSKVPELGDTLFIVLRKQNLIFLHWYHHITVLVFTWYSYWQHIAPARWYIGMNYLVHSFMYSYYALRALGYRLPKPLAMCITLSQISQMIMGFYVTWYAYMHPDNCQMPQQTASYGLAMYGSYFILFSHFFIRAYSGRSGVKKISSTNGAVKPKVKKDN